MIIDSIKNSMSFKAKITLQGKIKGQDMDIGYFFEEEKNFIKNSPTSNHYEILPNLKEKDYYHFLLNGEKFYEEKLGVPFFNSLQRVYKIIVEKEKSILALLKGSDLNTKLNDIRNYILKSGISIEDAKKFL